MLDGINITMRYNYITIARTCKDSNMDFIHKILAPNLAEFLIKVLQFPFGKADKLNPKGARRRQRGSSFSIFDGQMAQIARYVEKAQKSPLKLYRLSLLYRKIFIGH